MESGYKVEQISVGMKASMSKTIGESDIYGFAGITGDFNPIHVNEEYARTTRFGRRVAHGMILAGMFSAVRAMKVPGPGGVLISQTLTFKAPAFIGDTVTALVEVTSVNVEKNRIVMRNEIRNQDGVLLIEGESISSPRK
ncbi:MAG: MaoC family dehydratase [Anaerovoracaceae bacterium]|jgi:3-hydroxybutyryl-CoA dehydratase